MEWTLKENFGKGKSFACFDFFFWLRLLKRVVFIKRPKNNVKT
jgi:hypothetical protein